jgi:hypothetical protein
VRAHQKRNLRFGEPDFSCRFHLGQGWLPFHACWSLSALSGICCLAPKICSRLPELDALGCRDGGARSVRLSAGLAIT